MQWKTDSVTASNSWQGRRARAILLKEGNDKDDGTNYGVQELVRMQEGERHAETAEKIWHRAPMLVQKSVEPMVVQWCVEF